MKTRFTFILFSKYGILPSSAIVADTRVKFDLTYSAARGHTCIIIHKKLADGEREWHTSEEADIFKGKQKEPISSPRHYFLHRKNKHWLNKMFAMTAWLKQKFKLAAHDVGLHTCGHSVISTCRPVPEMILSRASSLLNRQEDEAEFYPYDNGDSRNVAHATVAACLDYVALGFVILYLWHLYSKYTRH